MNITALVRKTRLRYDRVSEVIGELERKGIVEDSKVGRLRIVRLNYLNRKVIILSTLLEELEDL